DQLLVLGLERQRHPDRALADLAGRAVGVVARLGGHRLAAAHPVGGADGALAGAAGALLLPGLLAAAGDQRGVLHPERAGAPVDRLELGDLVDQVVVGLGAEDRVRQVDLRDLLPVEIDDVELHDLISTSTPAERSSFISASSVCWVGSRMSRSRLCVRISNCSRLFLSTCGLRRTVNLLIRVGSGMGPATLAPVRLAVSTISPALLSRSLESYALSRIRIFCVAIQNPRPQRIRRAFGRLGNQTWLSENGDDGLIRRGAGLVPEPLTRCNLLLRCGIPRE